MGVAFNVQFAIFLLYIFDRFNRLQLLAQFLCLFPGLPFLRCKSGPNFLLGNFYFVVTEKYFFTTKISVLYIAAAKFSDVAFLNVRLNLYFLSEMWKLSFRTISESGLGPCQKMYR